MNFKVDLKDKIAVVTGGGRGIGRSIAVALAEDGANIAVVDVNLVEARETCGKIRSFGREALALKADVSVWNDVNDSIRKIVEEFGKIDILVNNAGVLGPVKPVVDLDIESWEKVIDVNLKGVFLCCKAVLPYMIKQNYGRIVNMASLAGPKPNPNMSAYSASKAGVIAFTNSLGKEVAKYNIRVNCICPTLIETPLLSNIEKDQLKELEAEIPIGRMGKPQEVARLVEFLVSDAVSFITGQAFYITGGI